MTPIIVPAYAALLVFIYIFLAVRVIRSRTTNRVSIGAGGVRELERRMRIHANFGEYVPFALWLLAFMEMQGRAGWWLHFLCIALVIARIGHAFALAKEIFWMRAATVTTTFFIMASAAIALLSTALRT